MIGVHSVVDLMTHVYMYFFPGDENKKIPVADFGISEW